MQKLKVTLKAGRPWPINRGRFVRVFDAVYPVKIKTQTMGTHSNQESELIANMGAEFQLFESAEIVSEYDQYVEIAYSELMIFDNRLGAESGTTLQTVAPQTTRSIENFAVNNTQRVKILDANSKRKSAIIATSAEVSFFDAEVGGVGFRINGDFDDESNSELWAIATESAMIETMVINYV